MSAANIPTIWKMSQDPCLPRTLCCPWLRFLHLGPGVPLRPGSQPSLASKPRTEILIILSVGLANSTSKPRTTEILSILSVGMANKPGFVSQVTAEAGHFLVPLHLLPSPLQPQQYGPRHCGILLLLFLALRLSAATVTEHSQLIKPATRSVDHVTSSQHHNQQLDNAVSRPRASLVNTCVRRNINLCGIFAEELSN